MFRLFKRKPSIPPPIATLDELKLHVTLWPSFPHFTQFANDKRIAGIRLNSAMMSNPELDHELDEIKSNPPSVPLWYDIKGRQLRITEVNFNPNYLDIVLNHPISVPLPVPVLFKAGSDGAELIRLEDGGRRLIFNGGPHFMVKPGESLHIRHPKLQILGAMFTDEEKEKVAKVRRAGFSKYYLSYVSDQRYVDEFRELIGPDAEVKLKIEDKKGLEFVAREFVKDSRTSLIAARGDLYVEIDRPHEIMAALKLIVAKDPYACVGSRIMLSVVDEPVPSCSDFLELAWLYDIGYREMMLCDELCLKKDLLTAAVNAFDGFRTAYKQ
ncbi:MAG: hypothetical protein WCT26_04810 [Candidatus Buchananbacteria bacterium]